MKFILLVALCVLVLCGNVTARDKHHQSSHHQAFLGHATGAEKCKEYGDIEKIMTCINGGEIPKIVGGIFAGNPHTLASCKSMTTDDTKLPTVLRKAFRKTMKNAPEMFNELTTDRDVVNLDLLSSLIWNKQNNVVTAVTYLQTAEGTNKEIKLAANKVKAGAPELDDLYKCLVAAIKNPGANICAEIVDEEKRTKVANVLRPNFFQKFGAEGVENKEENWPAKCDDIKENDAYKAFAEWMAEEGLTGVDVTVTALKKSTDPAPGLNEGDLHAEMSIIESIAPWTDPEPNVRSGFDQTKKELSVGTSQPACLKCHSVYESVKYDNLNGFTFVYSMFSERGSGWKVPDFVKEDRVLDFAKFVQEEECMKLVWEKSDPTTYPNNGEAREAVFTAVRRAGN